MSKLGHGETFRTEDSRNEIENMCLVSWCYRIASNCILGNEKEIEYFQMLSIVLEYVRGVKMQPETIGPLWFVIHNDFFYQISKYDVSKVLDVQSINSFIDESNRLMYFNQHVKANVTAYLKKIGARL